MGCSVYGSQDCLTGEITENVTITQRFYAIPAILASIGIVFATYMRKNDVEMEISLTCEESGEFKTSIVKSRDLVDNAVLWIDLHGFEKPEMSTMILEIRHVRGIHGPTAKWGESSMKSTEFLMVNGTKMPGQLCFTVIDRADDGGGFSNRHNCSEDSVTFWVRPENHEMIDDVLDSLMKPGDGLVKQEEIPTSASSKWLCLLGGDASRVARVRDRLDDVTWKASMGDTMFLRNDGAFYGLSVSERDSLGKKNGWACQHLDFDGADQESRCGDEKIIVYTAVTRGYDKLEPAPDDGIEYVCVTDDPRMSVAGWKTMVVPLVFNDAQRTSRFPKLLPHRLFPNYEISLYVDGNTKIMPGVAKLVRQVICDADLVVKPHPQRTCVYDEIHQCMLMGKDDPKVLWNQLLAYQSDNFPKNAGVLSGHILFRRHNDPRVVEFMERWWHQLLLHSRRDQTSFAYVLWKSKDLRLRIKWANTKLLDAYLLSDGAHHESGNHTKQDGREKLQRIVPSARADKAHRFL